VLFEEGVAEDVAESEVGVQREQAVAAGLVVGAHSLALRISRLTPTRAAMLLSPPSRRLSSLLTISLRS
jgi:hypothetical protein